MGSELISFLISVCGAVKRMLKVLLSSSFAILFISCDLVLLILIKISNILCYDCHQGVNWQCEILLIQMFNHPSSSSGWEAGWSRQPISRYIDCFCKAWHKYMQSHTTGKRLAFWYRSNVVALHKKTHGFCLMPESRSSFKLWYNRTTILQMVGD